MKIVILESLGISDTEFNLITKPLTDHGHELIAYTDGKLDDDTLKTRIKDADIIVIANTPLVSALKSASIIAHYTASH